MNKSEPTKIGFVCSFDMASNHELIFSFNPNKKMKNSSRKSQIQTAGNNQKQSHQTKAQKNAALKKASSQQQRSQAQNLSQLTASQPSQTTQLPSQSQLQPSASTQTVPINAPPLSTQQNQNSKNFLFSKNSNIDQSLLLQAAQQQKSIQSNQNNQKQNTQVPLQPETALTDQIQKSNLQAQQTQIQRPNINSNTENKVNTETSNAAEQAKQINESDHQQTPINIPSNSSLAFKNPIYQQIFQPKKAQQNQQPPQPSQPPQPPQAQPQQPLPQQQQQKQNQPTQPAQNVNQIQISPALLQAQLSLLLKSGNLTAFPDAIRLQLQFFLQQYQQQQQKLKMQKYKEQLDAKPAASKKKSKASANANDDFHLRSFSENSKKNAKLFIPASTTMYSTHHRNHKVIQDLTDEESDTYIPCTSSSSSSSSSSSNESEDEDEIEQPAKQTHTSQTHSYSHHNQSSSRSHHQEHPQKKESNRKIPYKPLDPRIKLKRRYASWAEITDYGQWKMEAKVRPHIIEQPRKALEKGINEITEERSEPLNFDHEFTILECLKVVSENLPVLANDGNENNNGNLNNNNSVTINNSSSDSNLSKSNSSSNLTVGLSKSDSIVSLFSSDKKSLSSVITPVITKRRLQRPNHIQLANIIDNFDNKMRSITCRACNMLDRLLLREILRNTAPSLHQSLQEIAPYVWREFQKENLQSSAKHPQSSSSGGNRRKKKRTVTLTAALAQSSAEVEDAFHVIKQTFEFLNICEKEETNYECEIRHMNFSQDYTFQPSFDDLVRYFRQVKGKFVSRSSSGYVLE